MLDTSEGAICTSLLETESVDAFKNAAQNGYQAAILRRNIQTLEKVKSALLKFMQERDYLTRLITPNEATITMAGLNQPLQEEFNLLLGAANQLIGLGTTKHFEIKRKVHLGRHPHDFAVTNVNWGSRGTIIETTAGLVQANEGDAVYIGQKIMHSSAPSLTPHKLTVSMVTAHRPF
jgi:hypothetical protein